MQTHSSTIQIILSVLLLSGCGGNRPHSSGSGSQKLSDKAWAIFSTTDKMIQFLIVTGRDENDFKESSSGGGSGPDGRWFQGYWKDEQGDFFLKYSGNVKDGLVNSMVNGKAITTKPGQVLYLANNGEVLPTRWAFMGTIEELIGENRMVENIIETFQQGKTPNSRAVGDP